MAPKKGNKKQRTSRPSTSSTRNLLSSQPYAKEKKEKLDKKELSNSHYLDWSVLAEFGLTDVLQNLIVDKRWFKVFDMREPAYRNLTIEVLSTLKFSGDEGNDEDDDGVQKFIFQAFGEKRKVPLRMMGVYLGYYESEEENSYLPTNWPHDWKQERLWFELINPKKDPFEPSKSLNSKFSMMEHKLLHHIIAHTLTCRKTSHSKLTTFDMFLLYSIIKAYQVDLGVEVGNFLMRQSEDTRTNWIFCGGYITQLLKGMGEFQEPVDDIKVEAKRISSGPFRSWGLTKIPRGVPSTEEANTTESPPEVPPIHRPSTSHAPPPSHPSSASGDQILEHLEFEVRALKEEFKQERRKNKKFRSTLMNALKSAVSCINPTAAQEIKYSTSEDGGSSDEEES